MAVLEAMAYGMGIVTSNVGGIPRLIEEDVSGYVCEPGNVDMISKKMIRLIREEECAKKCGENARKKAVETYSFHSHREKLQRVYDSL